MSTEAPAPQPSESSRSSDALGRVCRVAAGSVGVPAALLAEENGVWTVLASSGGDAALPWAEVASGRRPGALCVPVTTAGGAVRRHLALAGAPERVWTAEEHALLEELAALAAGSLSSGDRQPLDEGEWRRALLFDTILDGVLLMSPEGRITDCNVALERLYGYPRSELLGRKPEIFHHPAVRPWLEAQVRAGLQAEGCWSGELPFQRKDGTRGVADVMVALQSGPDGAPLGIVGVNRDVTGRYEAEQALRRREQEFVALVENAPDIITRFDLELRHRYVSPAIEREVGLPASAFLGRTHEELAREHGLPDAFWQQWKGALTRVRETGRKEVVQFEFPTPEGVSWYECRIVPEQGPGGAVESLLSIGRNVTALRKAEEAIRESEERYRLMVEGSEQAFFYMHDPDGRFTYLSPSIREVLGFAAEELLGRPYGVLLSGGESDAEVQQLTDGALLSGERVPAYFATVRHRDGRERILELVESPVIREGKAAGMQGFARDVTERRAADNALRLQKAYLEQLFDAAPEAIALLDNDSRVVRVNQEFTSLFGFTNEEAGGRAVDDLIAPGALHAEAEGLTAGVREGGVLHRETVRVRKDGSRVEVSVLGTPIRVGGVQVGVYGIYRDITERRSAQRKLATAEAHYRRLVEASPDGIFLFDAEGVCREANAALCGMLGRPPSEVLGRSFGEMVFPEDLPALRMLRERRSRGDFGTVELELRVVRPSGEIRLARVKAVPLVESGVYAGSHGVAHDVTDERQREEQLRRVERLASLGTLLSGVAHELNNPLTSIKSFAQLMLLDPRAEQDREALDIMRREADRAAKIVADLRGLSRQPVAGGQFAAVDLNDVARHVLRLRSYTLQTHNIQLRERLDDDLPRVWADRSQLEQVVLNLVVNAEQALAGIHAERWLEVRTERGEDGVVLRIADSGPGIAPEHREQIFDPFFTTKSPGEGTGLGLSLVHTIVTDHGGQVRLESGVGQGAAFVVLLPATREESRTPEAAPSPATPLNILVVDDESGIRRSLVRFLSRRGHRVDEATDGEDALHRLEAAAEYDVILADLRMPGLGGDQLFLRLQEQGRGVDRRLVFMTGDAANPDAERILTASGVPVVLKPFALRDVAEQLEQYAGARKSV